MLLRETGFSFGGRHSLNDFDLQWSESNMGHALTPAIKYNEYEIAGMDGTVLFGEARRQPISFSGTLYMRTEYESQLQAQARLREIQGWLLSGRQQLIFDYEPDKYYLAEVSRATAWSLKNWFGGELSVTFQAEPCAFSVIESVFTTAATAAAQLGAVMATQRPAPARIRVTNTGTAPITGLNLNQGQVVFAGLSVAAGHYIDVSCEPPISATIDGSANALPWCTAFSPILLQPGANTLTIAPAFGSGTAGYSAELRARGRW